MKMIDCYWLLCYHYTLYINAENSWILHDFDSIDQVGVQLLPQINFYYFMLQILSNPFLKVFQEMQTKVANITQGGRRVQKFLTRPSSKKMNCFSTIFSCKVLTKFS